MKRRILQFKYTKEFLNELLFLPEGSDITHVLINDNFDSVTFLVENDNFDPVESGVIVPTAILEIKTKQVVDSIEVKVR